MKKTFLCLVIAFAITTVVSAQDAEEAPDAAPAAPASAAAPAKAVELGGGTFSLGLYFNSGLQADWGSSALRNKDGDSSDGTGHGDGIKAYAQDADVDGYRANFDIGYDHKDWGLKLQIRSQADTANGSTDRTFGGDGEAFEWAFLNYGYAWYKPSDKVKVSGGIVDDGAWKSGGPIDEDVGEGRGALFNFYPVDGLNAGFGVYGTGYGTAVVLGAAYKTDAIGVHASTKLGRKWLTGDTPKSNVNPAATRNNNNTLFAGGTGLTDAFSKAFIGFNFTGVENLSLGIDSKIWVEEDDNDASAAYNAAGATVPKFKIGLDGNYTAGDLNAGLQIYYFANTFKGEKKDGVYSYPYVDSAVDADDEGQNFSNGLFKTAAGSGAPNFSTVPTLIDFSIKPYVSYKLQGGKIEPGMSVLIGFGGVTLAEDVRVLGLSGNLDPKAVVSAFQIQVKPKVVFNLADGIKFEGAYQYHFATIGWDKDQNGDKGSIVGQKSTIYLDFLLSY
jgi:hypothetical protein